MLKVLSLLLTLVAVPLSLFLFLMSFDNPNEVASPGAWLIRICILAMPLAFVQPLVADLYSGKAPGKHGSWFMLPFWFVVMLVVVTVAESLYSAWVQDRELEEFDRSHSQNARGRQKRALPGHVVTNHKPNVCKHSHMTH